MVFLRSPESRTLISLTVNKCIQGKCGFLVQKVVSNRSLNNGAEDLYIVFAVLEIVKSRLYSLSETLVLVRRLFTTSTDMSVTATHPDLRGNSMGTAKTGSDVCPKVYLSRDRQLGIALFLLSCAYLWIFRRYTSMEPDEGIILQGAQRILRGEVLYRDFFSFFTPGSYYLQALISRIFGD